MMLDDGSKALSLLAHYSPRIELSSGVILTVEEHNKKICVVFTDHDSKNVLEVNIEDDAQISEVLIALGEIGVDMNDLYSYFLFEHDVSKELRADSVKELTEVTHDLAASLADPTIVQSFEQVRKMSELNEIISRETLSIHAFQLFMGSIHASFRI